LCITKIVYPSYFDLVEYPIGWQIPDFVKFNGKDSRTTWEQANQYLEQLVKASIDAFKLCLFSLSLAGMCSWEQLEQKFHDQFYSPDNELKLSDLTSFRQGCDEFLHYYIKIFGGTKN
jgi:hypothetical protein